MNVKCMFSTAIKASQTNNLLCLVLTENASKKEKNKESKNSRLLKLKNKVLFNL